MKKISFLLCFMVLFTLFSCSSDTMIITFETNGGVAIDPIDLSEVENFTFPTPIKEGYVFLGWFINSELTEPLNLKSPIDQSMTLYAKWREVLTHTITFDSNGGTSLSSVLVSEFDLISAPISPTKEGHQFIGWYTNLDFSTEFAFNQTIFEHVTLYAKWEKLSYTITFVTNGGLEITPKTIPFLEEINLNEVPILSNQTFLGWYLDPLLSVPFDLTHMPSQNLILYAKWGLSSHTISFDTDGGSNIEPIQLIMGANINLPAPPSKPGHLFTGWYLAKDDIHPFSLTEMPDYSFTLYADYETNGLLFELIDGENEYEVSLGEANDLLYIQIPKRHLGLLVTQIKTSGFSEAYSVEEIIIPSSIKKIGNFAFLYAHGLKQLYIPKSVTSIGKSICTMCYDLESVIVDSQNESYTSIDGILFSKDLKTLIRYPLAKTETSYIVPDYVETIDSTAFSYQQYLTAIDLGIGTKTIKDHAFYRSLITSIHIPDQVTTVELYAFRDCLNLSSVTIGTGLTTISAYMFDRCTSLTEIILPPNISFIGYGAFYDCTNLRNIYVMRPLALGVVTGTFLMFEKTHSTLKIYFIDQETLHAYSTSNYWSSYKTKFYVNTPTE
jgi:uncharacterized repeat protein (TIGR02543 family)